MFYFYANINIVDFPGNLSIILLQHRPARTHLFTEGVTYSITNLHLEEKRNKYISGGLVGRDG